MKKRLLSIFLVALMVVSLMPMTAFAEATKPEGSDWLVDSGDNHVWYKLEEVPASSGTYTLTIGGTGEMPDFPSETSTVRPWFNAKETITTVKIKSGVTRIGKYAFSGCFAVTALYIDSIESWCGVSFAEDNSHPLYNPKNSTLYVGDVPVTELDIPSSITSIPDYAFYNCSGLTSVKIPSSVTSIGNSAFSHTALTSVKIPSSVTSIGNSAFSQVALTSVLFENGSRLKSIGDSAFQHNALTNVTIPSSVTSIGKDVFTNTEGLTSITIKAANPPMLNNTSVKASAIYVPYGTGETYKAADNWSQRFIFGKIKEAYIVDVAATTNGAVTVSKDCFPTETYTEENDTVTVTVMPDEGYQLKSLSYYTTNPASATDITDTKSFTMPLANVTVKAEFELKPGTETNPWEIGPKGSESNVKAWLTEVTPATDPATYTLSISGTGAMVDYLSESDSQPWLGNISSITNVQIDQGVTSLGSYSFADFTSLSSVTIPASVTKIGANAFSGCSDIETIAIPTNVTSIGDNAFACCSKLSDITLPEGITVISQELFNGCTSLASITIPKNVTEIKQNAFSDCSNLASVNFEADSQLETIGVRAFYGCSKLTDIDIPSGVTSIGNNAFMDCVALESVSIPASIATINDAAFAWCENLTSVTINAATPPTLESNVFDHCADTLKIYVPVASVDTYKVASDWSAYASSIEAIPLKISDILPSDFPTTPESGWKNTTGVSIFLDNISGNLRIQLPDSSSMGLGCGLTSSLVYADNPYLTITMITPRTITFNMVGGVLKSISYDGAAEYDGNYAPPTPPTPVYSGGSSSSTITVPVSGDASTVKVSASVSGSTATVKPIKDVDLAKVTDGESVAIDLSGVGKNVDTAKIPTETVEKISEKSALTVKLPVATVEFDNAATAEIADQAKGNNIELVVDSVKEVSLNAVQKESVKKLDTALIIDAHLVSNGERLCSESEGGFGGGKATVILPYEIKNNRTAANYSVFYVDDAGKLQKLNAKYDEELAAFVFEIEHFSVYAVAYDENAMPFTDVLTDAYYYDAVKWAVEKEITLGKTDTEFDPNGSVTRAQAVTFLWRAAGKPVVNYAMNMSDVASGKYYTEAVRWALAEGITKGTDAAHFSPNATCTRGQIVSFLYRYAKAAATKTSNPFTDVKAGAYYYDAVLWAVENGITGGTSATTFAPTNGCTRAQVVTFIYRYMGK